MLVRDLPLVALMYSGAPDRQGLHEKLSARETESSYELT